MKRWGLIALAALTVIACDKKGPFQRAGEEIDEAVEDVKAGGEATGNKIDDAIDEAADAVDDATK